MVWPARYASERRVPYALGDVVDGFRTLRVAVPVPVWPLPAAVQVSVISRAFPSRLSSSTTPSGTPFASAGVSSSSNSTVYLDSVAS